MRKGFPFHGLVGLFFLILSQFFLFEKVEPFYSWFYCFAWWSYILTIDGFIYSLKGNSLILSRTREFFLMIPWSVFIWLIFEAANFSLENWYYVNIPNSPLERWLGYAIAYGTVLPGIFETAEFLETIGLFKGAGAKQTRFSYGVYGVLVLLGMVCLVSSVVFPKYFFPLVWGGFIFLLEPMNHRFGRTSLLRDLEEGNPRKIYLLLVAGLICGLLWEFWNFWAPSKWIYTVPFFEEMKGFEMPVPGFLGFPPFAVQVYVMYQFVSLFRFGRGWEESSSAIAPEKKTRPLTILFTAILMISFYVLIFRAIDLKTVDSYQVRLRDAYWIELPYRTELPKAGISSIDDLITKTADKKEKNELALRLLVPKEELNRWVEKAQLVHLKGLGIENLALLEQLGIHSVSVLASMDPDQLYGQARQVLHDRVPKKAKIRIWIREARKHVHRRDDS